MTTTQAEIIRDKALENDDAETWIAIHDEILWPRYVESLNTSWSAFPGLVLRHRSISKAYKILEYDRFTYQVEKPEFIGRSLSMIDQDYKPRIIQAAIDRTAELLIETGARLPTNSNVIGESLNSRLSIFLERQGRHGEAADQRWYAFLDRNLLFHFGRWLRLQGSGSEWMRENLIRKSLEKQYDKYPGDPWLIRLAGIIRYGDGKYAEAEPLLAKAAELFGDDPEGRHAWAEARLALHLPVDVMEIMGPPCRDSIHFGTQEAMRLTFRARLFELQGDLGAARRDVEAAVRIDPQSRESWETLARIAKKTGITERSQFAETQAREWAEKETRLNLALKSLTSRIEASSVRDPNLRDDGGTIESVIEALKQLEWTEAVEALIAARKIGSGQIVYPESRKIPVLQPGRPDRFFRPRPVLRSETPESRGLGGVRL